ncbi:MAG: preprotein translocase subunit SecG [Kiritimatiellae bacterium]|nr:preprotein translocase subunit SecG [Kiritimatiellia bacterium]
MVNFLYYLLTFVEVLCSFLLLGVILIQRSKSSGLGGLAVGAGMGETLFGPRAGNILTRATVVLAVIFLVNTTILALLGSRRQSTSVTDGIKGQPPISTTTPVSGPLTTEVTTQPAASAPSDVAIPIPSESQPTAPTPSSEPATGPTAP